jgi:uncharacterized membrane protein
MNGLKRFKWSVFFLSLLPPLFFLAIMYLIEIYLEIKNEIKNIIVRIKKWIKK